MSQLAQYNRITAGAWQPSVYEDFSDQDFNTELSRVVEQTGIERQWLAIDAAEPYQTDGEILADALSGKLQRVSQGLGYMVISKLAHWDPARSETAHPYYYSPPFLKPAAHDFLKSVAAKWQAEMGPSRSLAVTSLARSLRYQTELATRPRKITISSPEMSSSHTAGWAFDIDGCGLYQSDDNGVAKALNPRMDGYNRSLAIESGIVLKDVLMNGARSHGDVNVVEELPGTQEHCFHVCVRP